MATLLPNTASGRRRVKVKFHFEVGIKGIGVGVSVPEGPQVVEVARSLFCLGRDSLFESSEMSLSGGPEGKKENNLINTTNIYLPYEKSPVCVIKFLEGDAAKKCGATVAGGGGGGGQIFHDKSRLVYHSVPHSIQGIGIRATRRKIKRLGGHVPINTTST